MCALSTWHSPTPVPVPVQTNGFPTYSCAESWAVGMELKCSGWQGRYLRDFLTTGEAPHHLKSVFTDHNIRSRVTWVGWRLVVPCLA